MRVVWQARPPGIHMHLIASRDDQEIRQLDAVVIVNREAAL